MAKTTATKAVKAAETVAAEEKQKVEYNPANQENLPSVALESVFDPAPHEPEE